MAANEKDTGTKKEGDINSGWIDISWPLHTGMTYWPDNEPPKVEFFEERSKGGHTDCIALNIITHTGTHIDAPLHFIPDGATMDTMPLDALLGPARIIESNDPESIKVEELVQYDIQPGERILFKTQNSEKAYKSYELYKDYIYIDPDAAQFLVDKKISVVGIDYIAVGSYHHREKNVKTHLTFFENGVWVLEAINLARVRPGPCELACLPLRIKGGDAANARAIVRPL